jgi:glycosyltransferase involved in cell wall biosynthesis
MNSIAVFFNTDEVGGAERSLIKQFELAQKVSECDFYVPKINENKLNDFLLSKKFSTTLFDFPKILYKISRSSGLITWPMSVLSFFLPSAVHERNCNILKKYNIIYLNGNKVGLYLSILCYFSNNKARIIWHFRDYSPKSIIWRIFLSILYHFLIKKINLVFVANSNSVAKDWEILTRKNVIKIYNPVDHFDYKIDRPVQIIGSASMLAPWKGIQDILLCAKTYQQELKELGIRKIKIYGVNIYKTDGPHQEFAKKLKELSSDLVEFCGNKTPQIIFEELDILIHSSLTAEPFGRVITEAFKSGTGVITTGIGGAGEIIQNAKMEKCAEIYAPGDFHQLFRKIRLLVTDTTLRGTLKNRALANVTEIEKNLPQEFREILGINEQQGKNKFTN